MDKNKTHIEIEQIVDSLSIEEKASLCSGKTQFTTKEIKTHNIPSLKLSDGPYGVNVSDDSGNVTGSSRCYPTSSAVACTWNTEIAYKMAKALGDECIEKGVDVLLGPAMNIKRSPLGGRNFEYYSEDPYITGILASAYVDGLQSTGIGACVKHFLANNQETRRLAVNAEISERALREIYLKPFATTIKQTKPKMVMCSYNGVNGHTMSENRRFLDDILRGEWGYDGVVVSDWGAVMHRVPALCAGVDLEMPSTDGKTDREIVSAIENGELDTGLLNNTVSRLIDLAVNANHGKASTNDAEREALNLEIARESVVLLKNDDKLLPFKKNDKVAVIGGLAKNICFQGSGSSRINTRRTASVYDENDSFVFAEGYDLSNNCNSVSMLESAVDIAKKCDKAVVFVGDTGLECSEGFDRSSMELASYMNETIERICDVQKNTIVVIASGAPVLMPWIEKVKGVVFSYYGGERIGQALSDVLWGRYNPGGKIAETFPLQESDTPSFLNFPGYKNSVAYREDIFVGYRYYDKKGVSVLFPFGHGLSYTDFSYTDLKIKGNLSTDNEIEVSLCVTNTGDCDGCDIIQLYVRNCFGSISMPIRPIKELRAFRKIYLASGNSERVIFKLHRSDLSYFSAEINDFYAPSGVYAIEIGKSSRDILLSSEIEYYADKPLPLNIDDYTTFSELYDYPDLCDEVIVNMRKLFSKIPNPEIQAIVADEKRLKQHLGGIRISEFKETVYTSSVIELIKKYSI